MSWQDTSYLKFLMTCNVTHLVPHNLTKFQNWEWDRFGNVTKTPQRSISRAFEDVGISQSPPVCPCVRVVIVIGLMRRQGWYNNIVAPVEPGKLMWRECGSGYKNDPGAQCDQWLLAVNLSCLLQRTHTLTHTHEALICMRAAVTIDRPHFHSQFPPDL